MLRFILYGLIAFFIWRIVQSTMRIMHSPRTTDEDLPRPPDPTIPTPPKFTDIQDAHFEDLPPEKGEEPPAGKTPS